jgi:hypothetical protein
MKPVWESEAFDVSSPCDDELAFVVPRHGGVLHC